MTFFVKLHKLQQSHAGNLALLMTPRLTRMPLPMQRLDDPFLPFGKAIVAVTRDLVLAYVFDLAAYLALGAAGAVALERTAAYVGDDNLIVLHGAFVGAGYVAAAQAFAADAVTLSFAADAGAYQAAGIGVFILEAEALSEIGGETRLLLLGDDALYAGGGEDFAQQARAAVERAGR